MISQQESDLAAALGEQTITYNGGLYFVLMRDGKPVKIEREFHRPNYASCRRRVWERGQAKLPAAQAVLEILSHIPGGALGNGT